jgi:hypothetical protein
MSGAGPDFLTAAVSYFDDPDVVFVHKNHLINRRFITNQSVTYHTMDATWLRREIKEEFQGSDGSTVFFVDLTSGRKQTLPVRIGLNSLLKETKYWSKTPSQVYWKAAASAMLNRNQNQTLESRFFSL